MVPHGQCIDESTRRLEHYGRFDQIAHIVHALWISSVWPDIVKRIHESIHNLDDSVAY